MHSCKLDSSLLPTQKKENQFCEKSSEDIHLVNKTSNLDSINRKVLCN